jgi:signal transduction histidine kinase
MHVRQRDGYLAAPTARAMGAGRDLFGLRKDGTEVPIEIGLNPVRDGENHQVLAAIIDITDRKRAEKLRRLSTEFGQRALGSAEPGLLAKEAAQLIARVTGVSHVRISEIDPNGGLTVITGVGWPAAWLDGHKLTMGPQAVETVRTGEPVFGGVDEPFGLCNEATSQKIVSSASVPIRTKDAIVGVLHVATTERRKWAQDDVSFLLNVGTILGMAIDRERREGRIARLNIELQHRYDEAEAFSYSVAHDLRAPLRSVAGFADVLAEEYGAGLDDEARRFIKLIVAGANQMGSLIDALLSLSRVSRQEITRGPFDLTLSARSIVADLRAADPGRKIEVEIAPGMRVTGDAALLRTVVQNLLANAWKFTRNREPAIVQIGSKSIGGETVYSVKDNGVGFETEFPDDLFAPFKRLHGRDFEGTGIGLATVARIVQRHGGRVWAESQPGAGAEFFFTIGDEPRS